MANQSESTYKGTTIIKEIDRDLWKIIKSDNQFDFTFEELRSFTFHLNSAIEEELREEERKWEAFREAHPDKTEWADNLIKKAKVLSLNKICPQCNKDLTKFGEFRPDMVRCASCGWLWRYE